MCLTCGQYGLYVAYKRFAYGWHVTGMCLHMVDLCLECFLKVTDLWMTFGLHMAWLGRRKTSADAQ